MYGGDSTVARVGRASDTAHHVRANSTRMRMCSARGIAKRRSKRILTVRNRRAVEYLIEGLLGCKEEDRNSDRERISKTVVRLIGRYWLEMNLHVRHYFARAGTYASHCNWNQICVVQISCRLQLLAIVRCILSERMRTPIATSATTRARAAVTCVRHYHVHACSGAVCHSTVHESRSLADTPSTQTCLSLQSMLKARTSKSELIKFISLNV